MNEKSLRILQLLAALMVISGLLLWSEYRVRKALPKTVIKTVTDTLVIRDTVTVAKPVPFNVYVVDTLWYEVPIYAGRDTVYVPLPREAKVYQDSTYRAVVSGFRPSLDTITVFRRNTVVTVTEYVRTPEPRLSWGIQAGVGAGTGGITPYVGIGVQYRFGYLDLSRK